jgi:hypothetical protein
MIEFYNKLFLIVTQYIRVYNVRFLFKIEIINIIKYLVESRRVIFLLPIALKTIQAIESLAKNNAFPLITSTLASCEVQSNRGIIQNEALIALNIIMMLANR